MEERLALSDDFPFPAATEEAFTVLLAVRLAPVSGPSLSAESQAVVQRALSSLRTRYLQTGRAEAPGPMASAQAYGGWR